MKLRLTEIIGMTLLATLQCDCLGCPDSSCEKLFDVMGWCATSKTCHLNGQLATECECCGKTPDCPLWSVSPGTRIEIPFDEVWPLLGQRNDLIVSWSDGFGDESNVELLFDGVPEAPGMCTRKPGQSTGSVSCFNLPRTLQHLEFRYVKPMASGVRALLYIDMIDKECMDAEPPCGAR